MKCLILQGGSEALPHGRALRPGRPSSRSAGALALTGEGGRWVLINPTPAVAQQLDIDARLLRHDGLVDAPQRTVVLTDAQVDHVTGLLSLRDGVPVHLYATPAVFEELTHSLPILPMLEHYCGVHWHVIPVAGECREASFHVEGLAGLEFTALATDGPVPAHVPAASVRSTGETIALAVRDRRTGQRLFFSTGLSQAGPDALAWMQDAECVIALDDLDSEPADSDFEGDPDTLTLLQASSARRKVLLRLPGGLEEDASAGVVPPGIERGGDRMEIQL